jgi:sulfate-transporting ATPase
MIGGLAIGVAESELTRYVTTPGWAKSAPLLLIVGVLIARGRSLPARSQVTDRLPRVGRGRPRLLLVAAFASGGVLILTVIGGAWVDALTTTLTTALVCLSLVVVTGYAGQLSLAQFTLAGVGAFVAARLCAGLGWPFPLVAVAGALAAVPVGLLVALPALRTRGANLAIATLAMSLAVGEVVFANSDYTGGFQGVVVRAPTVGGLQLDPVEHPGRYAGLCLLVLVALAVMITNLRRGPAGRRLIAVRENERAAATLGISVYGAKLYAFGLSAAIAGLAGTLIAFRTQHVLFTGYDVFASINAVVLAVIGGIGAVLGAGLAGLIALGGLISYLVDRLTGWDRYLALASGLLVLLTLAQAPDGLAHHFGDLVTHVLARVRVRRARPSQSARPPRRTAASVDQGRDAARRRVAAAALVADGLTVRFGGVAALDGVSLQLQPGRVTGLIGPNGAGKTTLIDAISGLTPLVAGSITIGGRRIDRWTPSRRARAGIGRSFQALELFADMTVLDNIRAACDPRGTRAYVTDLIWPHNPSLPSAAIAAIEEFGLTGDLDRFPHQLAYGRRRMVAIARAVAAEPSVLLLDEPAAGLDEREAGELGELIRRLADDWGLAILLVEHDVGLVLSVCDRIVALDFGTVLAEGTPEQIRLDPAVIEAYLGTGDRDGVTA